MQDFHPLIAEWFRGRFNRPTACQLEAWPLPQPLSVPAADPLNLTGIVLQGPRVSALASGLVELLPAADLDEASVQSDARSGSSVQSA